MSGRSSNKKLRRSSIYRSIELLELWTMNIGNKVPANELSLQHLIARVNDEFIDALAACSYALEEYISYDDKLELIHLMKHHLRNAYTVIRLWHEYSKSHNEIATIVDDKQMAYFLTETEKIYRWTSGWTNGIRICKQRESMSDCGDK